MSARSTSTGIRAAAFADTGDRVRAGLEAAARRLEADGLAVPRIQGKLLRPRFAFHALPSRLRAAPPAGFWEGALAVQAAHEASLYHDDILDGADERRGRATEVAERGLAAALVTGDRLLTSSYRAAHGVGSVRFARIFAEAVDRTVEGEANQGRSAGRTLDLAAYRAIVAAKSGSLFGAALCLAACVRPDPSRSGVHPTGSLEGLRSLGVRAGSLYQMVDDLLDYCPALSRGKSALADHRQGKWTYPLHYVGEGALDRDRDEVRALLLDGEGEARPLRRALALLEAEATALCRDLQLGLPDAAALVDEVRSWVERAREGVEAEERWARRSIDRERLPAASGAGERAGSSPASPRAATARTEVGEEIAAGARAVGGPEHWPELFARHSRSFRFASLLFPAELRDRVTGVYVFCRFTDDLVDEAPVRTPEALARRLDAWRTWVERAYWTGPVGIPLLDEVVTRAADEGISFGHLSGLLDGVGMDVEPREYPDLDAVRRYTHRVASVVGGWITELLGIRSPAVLQRAYALGHAMQLTNILRDVGEDARAGRLYLPLDRMAVHGVRRGDLEAAARGLAPVPAGFPDLVEELLIRAEEAYDEAFRAIPSLPRPARLPVAAAARIYRGIHREIRRNGYDTLTRRAYTSLLRKLWLALGTPPALARTRLFGSPIAPRPPARAEWSRTGPLTARSGR